jgi:hypothetical protein
MLNFGCEKLKKRVLTVKTNDKRNIRYNRNICLFEDIYGNVEGIVYPPKEGINTY